MLLVRLAVLSYIFLCGSNFDQLNNHFCSILQKQKRQLTSDCQGIRFGINLKYTPDFYVVSEICLFRIRIICYVNISIVSYVNYDPTSLVIFLYPKIFHEKSKFVKTSNIFTPNIECNRTFIILEIVSRFNTQHQS